MYAAYGDKLSDFLDTLALRVQHGDPANAVADAVIAQQPQAVAEASPSTVV